MTRRILVAAVNAMAAVANRIITRPEVPTVPAWDEAMDGPASTVPVWDMPMTAQEMADYHRSYCALIQHEAGLRAAEREADFEAWTAECMAGGEQS